MNKNKIMGIIVVFMFMFVSISNALAGTVSNSDTQTTTTDSNLVIDYSTGTFTGDNFVSLTSFLFDGTVDRWINDSSDNIDSFVRNSNGKYWEATGANIHLALANLGDSGGTVWLAGNATYDPSSMITVGEGVTLDMQRSVIKPTSSYNIVYLKEGAEIKNGEIDTTGITMNNNHACVLIDGNETFTYVRTAINNMFFDGKYNESQGTAIKFYCHPDSNLDYIMWVSVSDVVIQYYNKAIEFDVIQGSDSDFCNGNVFNNILIDESAYGIHATNDHSNGNMFTNIQFESGWKTKEVIKSNQSHCTFEIDVYDWNHSSRNYPQTGYYAFNFSSDSQDNFIRNTGSGYLDIDVRNEGSRNFFHHLLSSKMEGINEINSNDGTSLYLNKDGGDDINIFTDTITVGDTVNIHGSGADYGVFGFQNSADTFVFLTTNKLDITSTAGRLILGSGGILYLRAITNAGDDVNVEANDNILLHPDNDDNSDGEVRIGNVDEGNYTSIDYSGIMNFTGTAGLNLPTTPSVSPNHGRMEFYDVNNTIRVYNATISQWFYYDHL